MGVSAVLEQEDAMLPAVGRDSLHVKGDVASDVHQDAGPGPVSLGLLLEGGERHAEVLTVAVHEHRPAARLEDRPGAWP